MKPEVSTFLTTKFKDKAIVIVGLGREGLSTYRLLQQALPEVAITLVDDRPLGELNPVWSEISLQNSHLTFQLSSDWLSAHDETSLVFLTPGLPLHHPIRIALASQLQRLTSNTELFLEIMQACWPSIKTIGITGTKGKSTTTSVLHHLLKTAEMTTWIGGNLGKPALDLVAEISNTPSISEHAFVVLELSAHQLDLCQLSPQIAVIQNVAPEHLDYYQTFERYFSAKTHLTQHQQVGDLVIYNPVWETAAEIAAISPGEKATFITSQSSNELDSSTLAQIKDDQIQMRLSASNDWQVVMRTDQVPLAGTHNLENVLPSVVLAAKLQLSPTLVAKAISSFQSLENRLEKVTDINGVSYYNDSLATVQEATVAALAAFKDKKIILLAGGFDRGQPLKRLAEAILAEKIKSLILFPTTGDRLLTELQTLQPTLPFEIKKVESMVEAVQAANQVASPGDVVLLSPAAASFNAFKDYQDRADQFKMAVTELATKN